MPMNFLRSTTHSYMQREKSRGYNFKGFRLLHTCTDCDFYRIIIITNNRMNEDIVKHLKGEDVRCIVRIKPATNF